MVSNQIVLLRIIKYNDSFSTLEKRQLSPSQIVLMIEDAKQNGLVVENNFKLSITPKGENVLEEYYKKHELRKSDSWILRNEDRFMQPKEKDDIFIPRKI